MPSKEKAFHKENQQKNFKFLALCLPTLFGLWVCSSLFFFYLNPRVFSELPQNIREEFITSLFFYQGHWNFPVTLIDLDTIKVPLSLTDNIPMMAILFKLFNSQQSQYFGAWITISTVLYTFFAYRLCRYIFHKKNYLLIGLCTLLFLLLPFIWYHPIYVPWLAGIWVILWAYSVYFRHKSYISMEWIGIMVFSSLIHPFFSLICFWIMIADLIHLYIYNHSISPVKVASSFGNVFTACFLTMGITGLFYLPSYLSNDIVPMLQLSTQDTLTYNISYLKLGYGVIIGLALIVSLIAIYPTKLKQYIYYYRALGISLTIFLFLGVLGGISIGDKHIVTTPKWIYEHTAPLFTSGPKFLIPIILLVPIIIITGIYKLEQYKKHLGSAILILIISIQVKFPISLTNAPPSSFTPLSQDIQVFLQDIKHIKWIFIDKTPLRPSNYEQLAYYAYTNKKTINAIPVIRFPSQYKELSVSNKQAFLEKKFQQESVYIVKKEFFPKEFFSLGETIILKEDILFKPTRLNNSNIDTK